MTGIREPNDTVNHYNNIISKSLKKKNNNNNLLTSFKLSIENRATTAQFLVVKLTLRRKSSSSHEFFLEM